MADFNNCSFTGRLTKDATSKIIPSGTELVEFDLANNSGYGERQKVMYIKCNLWGNLGKGVKQYLVKGKAVAVSGELRQDEWQGQDGQVRRNLVLDTRSCILLSANSPKPGDDVRYEAKYTPPGPPIDAEIGTDDIVF